MVPIINSWIVKLLLSRWTNRGVLDLLADLTPLRRLFGKGSARAEARAADLREKRDRNAEGWDRSVRGCRWCMNELTGRNRSTVLPNNFQLLCMNAIDRQDDQGDRVSTIRYRSIVQRVYTLTSAKRGEFVTAWLSGIVWKEGVIFISRYWSMWLRCCILYALKFDRCVENSDRIWFWNWQRP